MSRAFGPSVLIALFLGSANLLNGQQPVSPTSLLIGALAGMGGSSIQTVTLAGSAESIAGSSDDTGTFTGNCAMNGSSQLSLQLSGGSRTENRQVTNNIPTGSWIDSSGAQHPMVQHNLYTPASWFCPVVALSQLVSSSSVNVQFIGNEQKNGTTLGHFTVTCTPAVMTSPVPTLITHLTQVDLY